MGIIPRGGRGHKAPYQTMQVRVPVPIEHKVKKLIADYRQSVLTGEELVTDELDMTLTQALVEAKKIIKQKKSARVSMAKLLSVIYGQQVSVDKLN